MAIAFNIKQGATFRLNGVYTDTNGGHSLTGKTLTSQIRTRKHELVTSVTITVVDEALGTCIFEVVDTTLWPVGTLFWDIKVSQTNTVLLTESKEFNVLRSETL